MADPTDGVTLFTYDLDNNLTSVIDGSSTAEITWFKGLVAGSVTVPIGLLTGGQATLLDVRIPDPVVGDVGIGECEGHRVVPRLVGGRDVHRDAGCLLQPDRSHAAAPG